MSLSSKYGGGSGALINDAVASPSTTYSSNLIESDNATQDAAITAVDAEIDFVAAQNSVFVPASLSCPQTKCVTIDPSENAPTDAVGLYNVFIGNGVSSTTTSGTASYVTVIGGGLDSASSTLELGSGTTVVGGLSCINLTNTGTILRSTYVGTGCAYDGSDPGSVTDSVGVGNSVDKEPGAGIVNGTAIGYQAGIQSDPGTAVTGVTWVGSNANTDTLAYTSGDIGTILADYDIIVASATSAGTSRALIHGSCDNSAPHWSPGISTADLGTTARPWRTGRFSSNVYLSSTARINDAGAFGMYDYARFENTGLQASVTDQASTRLNCPTVQTASALGHITAAASSHFQNTSGWDARWLVEATAYVDDNVMYSQVGVGVSSTTNVGGTTQPMYGLTSQRNDSSSSGTAMVISITTVVPVPEAYYIALIVYGDTADGSTWNLGTTTTTQVNSIQITELPR